MGEKEEHVRKGVCSNAKEVVFFSLLTFKFCGIIHIVGQTTLNLPKAEAEAAWGAIDLGVANRRAEVGVFVLKLGAIPLH